MPRLSLFRRCVDKEKDWLLVDTKTSVWIFSDPPVILQQKSGTCFIVFHLLALTLQGLPFWFMWTREHFTHGMDRHDHHFSSCLMVHRLIQNMLRLWESQTACIPFNTWTTMLRNSMQTSDVCHEFAQVVTVSNTVIIINQSVMFCFCLYNQSEISWCLECSVFFFFQHLPVLL